MDTAHAIMDDSGSIEKRFSRWFILGLLFPVILCGCRTVTDDLQEREGLLQKTFVLDHVTAERGKALLAELGLSILASVAEPNTLLVSGPVADVQKASIVLEVIDVNTAYSIQTLAPASMARDLPSNREIAKAIGNIELGTFSSPPKSHTNPKGIIDIHGEAIIAIVPEQLWPEVRAIVAFGPETIKLAQLKEEPPAQQDNTTTMVAKEDSTEPEKPLPTSKDTPPSDIVLQLTESTEPEEENDAARELIPEPSPPLIEIPKAAEPVMRGVLKPTTEPNLSAPNHVQLTSVSLPDANEVIELTLPEKIKLAQLIDLVGEYLKLDCLYEDEQIGELVINLKLHSEMRSEVTVKKLYVLLETVLKSKGLAMIRHDGNLVSIVQATEALNIDPDFVDPNGSHLQAGDMVVTRVFELQHVDVVSVTSLLQSMNLGVTISAIPETQTLFVTCYAHRLARIERLVNMVDKPGRPREFRFRKLKYTMAPWMATKVLTLADELQDIPIAIAPSADVSGSSRSSRRDRNAKEPVPVSVMGERTVYLDVDERTNRLLMIGHEKQLETLEGLIDILDIPQDDQPILIPYSIIHVSAVDVLSKLTTLGFGAGDLKHQPARSLKTDKMTAAGATYESLDAGPQIVLLEATNSLLVNATRQQHEQLRTLIGYIDVSVQDPHILHTYEIQYGDAEEVLLKLDEFGAISGNASLSNRNRSPRDQVPPDKMITSSILAEESPQVMVLEATNSLLVSATQTQHERLKSLIAFIDVQTHQTAIPYEIHFLENQDPNHLAGLLERLVQETVVDKEGKTQKVVSKTEDEVTIIPDAGTYSLIVHANRKNQEWIGDLIKQLDKRRPQVLIDVTLVEITKSDAFSYDLNIVKSFPDLTNASGITGVNTELVNKLSGSPNSFLDLQSNSGDLTAFYGDSHIQLLLQAMQSKDYGRVLAKPKILVNDNQPGNISTTDTTYVKTEGAAVIQGVTEAIQTSVSYDPYDAGIKLTITPHISEGNLLQLSITMTRSDFRETANPDKPPNTTSSEIDTTVTLPNGSTVILGGLIRLNQAKGGTKVPLLGDLPIVGALFRSIGNVDSQSQLYIFVKAEIIRADTNSTDLKAISQKNRDAFEEHEQEFQTYQTWPGLKPKPVDPPKVLEAQ